MDLVPGQESGSSWGWLMNISCDLVNHFQRCLDHWGPLIPARGGKACRSLNIWGQPGLHSMSRLHSETLSQKKRKEKFLFGFLFFLLFLHVIFTILFSMYVCCSRYVYACVRTYTRHGTRTELEDDFQEFIIYDLGIELSSPGFSRCFPQWAVFPAPLPFFDKSSCI